MQPHVLQIDLNANLVRLNVLIWWHIHRLHSVEICWKKINYSKVFCSLRNAPSFSCGWPGLLISVRRVILRMMKISSRWHLRAEAKKRFSVDTELAPPFLTQVQTLFKDLFIKIYPNIGQIMINTQDEPQKIIYWNQNLEQNSMARLMVEHDTRHSFSTKESVFVLPHWILFQI